MSPETIGKIIYWGVVSIPVVLIITGVIWESFRWWIEKRGGKGDR
jgi:cytochrome b subunit of formate dehydrogenase